MIKYGMTSLAVGCAMLTTTLGANDTGSNAVNTGTMQLLLLDDAVCDTPGDFFSGSYLMEQLSGKDPFFNSETFGDTQIVDIVRDGYRRSFDFRYYPGIFDSDYNFSMLLDCGKIRVNGTINSGGLGCGGANVGFATGDPVSTYTEEFDDDVILVNVSDYDPDGNCKTGPYPVELRFTKQ